MFNNDIFSFFTETPPPPYSRYAMEDLKPKGKNFMSSKTLNFYVFYITLHHVFLPTETK